MFYQCAIFYPPSKASGLILLPIRVSFSLNRRYWLAQENRLILLRTDGAGAMRFWITQDPRLSSSKLFAPHTLDPEGTQSQNALP